MILNIVIGHSKKYIKCIKYIWIISIKRIVFTYILQPTFNPNERDVCSSLYLTLKLLRINQEFCVFFLLI